MSLFETISPEPPKRVRVVPPRGSPPSPETAPIGPPRRLPSEGDAFPRAPGSSAFLLSLSLLHLRGGVTKGVPTMSILHTGRLASGLPARAILSSRLQALAVAFAIALLATPALAGGTVAD